MSICQHFSICGGCTQQDVDHTEQLKTKQQQLLELVSSLSPTRILPPIKANIWGYRSKARLGVKFVAKKSKVLVGFREKRNSRYLAEISGCEVLVPELAVLIVPLQELIAKLSVFNQIPQIEAAFGEQKVALIFRILQTLNSNDLELLEQFGVDNRCEIYLQPKGPDTVEKFWPRDGIETLSYKLEKFNLEYDFHPLNFTQVNQNINQLLIEQAIQLLDLNSNDTVLDLFCGIGNFTLPIAMNCNNVVGVESGADMVARATHNAKINNITNVQFIEKDLYNQSLEEFFNGSYTKILLDPPRTGAEQLLDGLAAINPHRIVYVSCNPQSFARDAKILCDQLGYMFAAVGIVDMFPHTDHIETIGLFENGKTP